MRGGYSAAPSAFCAAPAAAGASPGFIHPVLAGGGADGAGADAGVESADFGAGGVFVIGGSTDGAGAVARAGAGADAAAGGLDGADATGAGADTAAGAGVDVAGGGLAGFFIGGSTTACGAEDDAAPAPFLLSEYLLGEATYVLIFSVAGMGVMLLSGHAGQPTLGHGAFLAAGAYMQTWLANEGWPFLISFPLAGLFAGVVGAIVAIPALRMSGIYLAIATLAFGIITEDVIILLEHWTGGIEGIFAPDIAIAGVDFGRYPRAPRRRQRSRCCRR